MTIIIIMFILD